MTLSKTATLGLSETRRTTMRGGGIKKKPSLIPGFKSPFPHKNKKIKLALRRLVFAQRLYAAPSSQGRVCAEIGSVISQQRRLLHSTVGSRAGMMMVLGILHGRKVPLSALMRVVPAIGQGETLLSAHFATVGQ